MQQGSAVEVSQPSAEDLEHTVELVTSGDHLQVIGSRGGPADLQGSLMLGAGAGEVAKLGQHEAETAVPAAHVGVVGAEGGLADFQGPLMAWCCPHWKSAARPGKAGMSAPRRNATSAPLRSTNMVDELVAGAADKAITEPAALRGSDGSSASTVAGSDLFISTHILAAEQRPLSHGGPWTGSHLWGR
jgi:hypothetical protein